MFRGEGDAHRQDHGHHASGVVHHPLHRAGGGDIFDGPLPAAVFSGAGGDEVRGVPVRDVAPVLQLARQSPSQGR